MKWEKGAKKDGVERTGESQMTEPGPLSSSLLLNLAVNAWPDDEKSGMWEKEHDLVDGGGGGMAVGEESPQHFLLPWLLLLSDLLT